jgi:branched-subunit amino acid aminotransferase/4-amino-4-deoxychorismate lyase
VQVRPYTRDLPAVKHIALFGALYERRAAQLAGFDDVAFSVDDGFISEGATWNIGFYDGTNIIWPDADILPGVTMTLLRQVHDDTVVRPVKTTEVRDMRAAFATNTTVGVRAISQIDDVEFPVDHDVFDILRAEFSEIPPEVVSSS